MDTLIPDSRDFLTENEISNYVTQRFFRCVSPFLSWLKKGQLPTPKGVGLPNSLI